MEAKPLSAYLKYIRGLFEKSQPPIQPSYINKWLSNEYHHIWEQSRTHASADPKNNYEDLEFIGDRQLYGLAQTYIQKKFPDVVSQHFLNLLHTNYVNRVSLSKVMEAENTLQYFKISPEYLYCYTYDYKDRLSNKDYTKFATDMGESIIGAIFVVISKAEGHTAVAVAVLEKVIPHFFNQIEVPSLDETTLSRPQHTLKEWFDKQKTECFQQFKRDNPQMPKENFNPQLWTWVISKPKEGSKFHRINPNATLIEHVENQYDLATRATRPLYVYEIRIPDLGPRKYVFANKQFPVKSFKSDPNKSADDASDQVSQTVINYLKLNGYPAKKKKTPTERTPPHLADWCLDAWKNKPIDFRFPHYI